jgi:hypothetical protein
LRKTPFLPPKNWQKSQKIVPNTSISDLDRKDGPVVFGESGLLVAWRENGADVVVSALQVHDAALDHGRVHGEDLCRVAMDRCYDF